MQILESSDFLLVVYETLYKIVESNFKGLYYTAYQCINLRFARFHDESDDVEEGEKISHEEF